MTETTIKSASHLTVIKCIPSLTNISLDCEDSFPWILQLCFLQRQRWGEKNNSAPYYSVSIYYVSVLPTVTL